jgi:SOS regulatory protein LexA
MNFEGSQKRFLNMKSLGFQVLKGDEGTGKTTVAIYRVVNLSNNYCLYMNEKIGIIMSSDKKIKEAKKIYGQAKENMGGNFYSLFSTNEERVRILNLNDIIKIYARAYERSIGVEFNFADDQEKNRVLEPLVLKKREENVKLKFLKNAENKFLLEEIQWIKAGNFSREEYAIIDRKGREKRIKKESVSREILYDLMVEYSLELNNQGLKDEYDEVLFALKQSHRVRDKFTHIVIDNCEELTKAEFDFVKRLYENKEYSSFILIMDNIKSQRENVWFTKGRKVNTINPLGKIKSVNFKNQFKKEEKVVSSIENYEFFDLKHRRVIDFVKDSASISNELLVEEGNNSFVYTQEELLEIPMYRDIAAGEPILMSSEQESIFSLPKQWFRGSNETFILHVKGDSMKNANINDGDLVVIKRQSTAEHNQIVAVDLDGSATLKRLNMKSKIPYLMPENPKYYPISLEDKEANILGIAVGIIKKKS